MCRLLRLRCNYANKSTIYRMLHSEERGHGNVSAPIMPYLILSTHTTSGSREPIGLAWVRRTPFSITQKQLTCSRFLAGPVKVATQEPHEQVAS